MLNVLSNSAVGGVVSTFAKFYDGMEQGVDPERLKTQAWLDGISYSAIGFVSSYIGTGVGVGVGILFAGTMWGAPAAPYVGAAAGAGTAFGLNYGGNYIYDNYVREPLTDRVMEYQQVVNDFNQNLNDYSGSNSSIRYHEPWKFPTMHWPW